MRIIYTITLFLCSSLLFLVEPMVAKMILPTFGGSPSVWNACVLFFQTVLLLGYLYAHLTTKWLGAKKQALFHVAFMLLPLLLLPIIMPQWNPRGSSNPTLLLLGLLMVMAGLPFFILSAGAPLLQKWFANTSDPDAKDPYFLYRASNLGSMVALIAYPALYEPSFNLANQSKYWSYGYIGLVVLIAFAAITLWRNPRLAPVTEEVDTEPQKDPTWANRLYWIALSAVPASLMMGITTFLTSNLSPIPLLWVIPLALYLLTFVIGFAPKPVVSASILSRLLPLIVIPMAIVLLLESSQPMLPIAILHLLAFFVAALMCHTLLNGSRPSSSHLTEFYLWISVGGVIGGVFNSVLAPIIFKTVSEYPIAIIAACLLRPGLGKVDWKRADWLYPAIVAAVTILIVVFIQTEAYYSIMSQLSSNAQGPVRICLVFGIPAILCFFAIDRPLRFGISLSLFLFIATVARVNSGGHIVMLDRSFFGVHRVEVYNSTIGGVSYPSALHLYAHGTTVHGRQLMVPEYRYKPLTYYYPTGPIGQVILKLNKEGALKDLALVGLGTGSLAAYGQPGQNMVFYEIDPKVVQLARDSGYFTYVTDSKAKVSYVLGDARLSLVDAPDHSYDIIVLDAFSSDAIPVHLMTKQALELYASKLRKGGIIAFHVSNRYLNLAPIVANLAESTGMVSLFQDDDIVTDLEAEEGKYRSKWVILSPDASAMARFDHDPHWVKNPPNKDYPLWTDDYSNILRVLTP